MRSWFDARSPIDDFSFDSCCRAPSRICFAFLSIESSAFCAARARIYIFTALCCAPPPISASARYSTLERPFCAASVRCLCTASRPFLLCIFNSDSLGHGLLSLLLLSANNKKTMMESQTNRFLHDARKKRKKISIIDELLRGNAGQ